MQEDTITHTDMVTTLAKPGTEIADEMTPINWAVLRNAITGLLEAGDRLDNAKKQVIYNKNLGMSGSPARVTPTLTDYTAAMLHMAIGNAGEAVELLESVFDAINTGSDFDRDHLIEELGDQEFYLEGFRQAMHVTRDATLEANITKLAVRYKGFEYSDQAAQDRADKQDLPDGNAEISAEPDPSDTAA